MNGRHVRLLYGRKMTTWIEWGHFQCSALRTKYGTHLLEPHHFLSNKGPSKRPEFSTVWKSKDHPQQTHVRTNARTNAVTKEGQIENNLKPMVLQILLSEFKGFCHSHGKKHAFLRSKCNWCCSLFDRIRSSCFFSSCSLVLFITLTCMINCSNWSALIIATF